MDYVGQWGGGGPGHSWALKWQRAKRVPFKCIFSVEGLNGTLVEDKCVNSRVKVSLFRPTKVQVPNLQH